MKRLPLIVVVCLALAGCGGATDAEPTATPTPTTSAPTPPAEGQIDVPAAIATTRAADTAGIDILILTTLGDQEAALSGTGSVEFTTGFADITWSDDSGVVVERKTADGLFVHIDPPDGPWYELAEGDDTPTTFSLEPLADLEDVQRIVNEGPEQLGDRMTTRFVGIAPPAGCLDGAGFSDEDRAQIEAASTIVCRVSIWVDDADRIVRIDRLFSAEVTPELRASSLRSTTLRNFGDAVLITTPQQVEPAPESP